MSQIPGYTGKRSFIATDFNISPALVSFNITSTPVNIREGLLMQRVFSRSMGGGLSLYAIHTGVKYEWQDREGISRIRGLASGLNLELYNFFRRGNIAPLGPYERLEVLYIWYNMRDLDGNFYEDGREDLGNYADLAVALTFGTKRVVSESLILHAGMQFAYATGFFRNQSDPSTRELKRLSSSMLKGYFAVNLNIGIGILIF